MIEVWPQSIGTQTRLPSCMPAGISFRLSNTSFQWLSFAVSISLSTPFSYHLAIL